MLERALKKISSVVTLRTKLVKAGSQKLTPDAAPTTSEKEELEPPVVAADGPEGVAARKATACPLTASRMVKLKSCTRFVSGSCPRGHL